MPTGLQKPQKPGTTGYQVVKLFLIILNVLVKVPEVSCFFLFEVTLNKSKLEHKKLFNACVRRIKSMFDEWMLKLVLIFI